MTQEIVMVPVPVTRLNEVYRLLGDDKPNPAGPSDANPMGAWSRALLTKIYNESPASIKGVLKHLSASPNKEIPIDEVFAKALKQASPSASEKAGVFGAFGRRLKNRHGVGSPIQKRWDGPNHQTVLSLSTEVAEVIRSL